MREATWRRACVLLFALAGLLALPVASASGAGAQPTGGWYVPVGPTRLLDTRATGQRLPAGGVLTVDTTPAGTSGVVAAVLNVTATEVAGPGFVTAWPADQAMPPTSSLNATAAGQTVAASAIVPVAPDGSVRIYSQAGADIVVDLSGWFTTAGGARFVPSSPTRAFDSRSSGRPLGAGQTVRISMAGIVPSSASAVAANVTVADAAGPGYFTVWPAGRTRPGTSNVNATRAGQTIANQVIVSLGGGSFDVFAQTGGHVIVDVTGYFTSSPGSDGMFVPITPTRLEDTREAGWPLPALGVVTFGVPAGAGAVAGTLTATEATGPGWASVFPAGTAIPGVSTLNPAGYGDTVANAAITGVSTYGLSATVTPGGHLVFDATGYFTGTPIAVASPPPPPPAPLPSWQAEELALVNQARAANGLPALSSCAALGSSAQWLADDLAARGTVSHVGSDGSTLVTRFQRVGITNAFMAENAAAGQRSVAEVMDAWMGSAGHRANILSSSVRYVGFGWNPSGAAPYYVYWVQDFSSSC